MARCRGHSPSPFFHSASSEYASRQVENPRLYASRRFRVIAAPNVFITRGLETYGSRPVPDSSGTPLAFARTWRVADDLPDR